MLISEFISSFERVLPPALAMPDDPVGLQILPEDGELTGVVGAYEVDVGSVRSAVDAGANLVVAFHPLIYPSVSSIRPDGRVGRTIIQLIDARVSLYVVHTAFDAHSQGTSWLLAKAIGLGDVAPLVPHADRPDCGMGAIGVLPRALHPDELAEVVRRACGSTIVRMAGSSTPGQAIRRVAVLGGSGMSFYDRAVEAGAEAFVTADVRYHAFHAANDRIPVIDPGHAESERFVPDGIAGLISETLGRLEDAIPVLALPVSTNPVRYIVNQTS